MKFIADGMLGKNARWLRMLGYDVTYSTRLNDFELESIAKEEHRILLTRDLELYRHASARGIDAFYVQGRNEHERLAELARRFKISLSVDMENSRCPKCSGKIQPVPKEKVAQKVESNTFKYYDAFWECPYCGKIYWQGAHWVKIRAILEEAQQDLRKIIES